MQGKSDPSLGKRITIAAFIGLLLGIWSCSSASETAHGQGSNLIKNGGFEEGGGRVPNGWIFEDRVAHKGTVSLQRTWVHSGKYGLRLAPNKENRTALLPLAIGQALPAEPYRGKTMYVSGWVGAEGGAVGVVGLYAIRGDGQILASVRLQGSGQKGLEFKEATLQVPASSDVALLIFNCSVDGTSGTAYFDDVFVGLASQPGSAATPSGAGAPGCDPTWNGHDPTKINNAGWTDSPFISPDGKRLFFMYTPWNLWPQTKGGLPERRGPDRPRHHNNPNPWDDSDIYVATRKADGTWSAPVNLGFNGPYSDCCGMPSYDGNSFYYNSSSTPKSRRMEIYVVSKKADGTWGTPVNLGPPINASRWSASNPQVSTDERTIYFTSDRPGGYGKNDLWYSTKKPDGTWSEPVNLGPNINTAEDEDQIWVSVDGKTTYFNRGPSIYKAALVNGTWSKPTRVDLGRSGLVGEATLTEDGKEIYFVALDECRRGIVVMHAEKQRDGNWGPPKPVD